MASNVSAELSKHNPKKHVQSSTLRFLVTRSGTITRFSGLNLSRKQQGMRWCNYFQMVVPLIPCVLVVFSVRERSGPSGSETSATHAKKGLPFQDTLCLALYE